MPGVLPGIFPSVKAFCRALRCSGATAAAALMSPGMKWWRRAHGCSAGCFAGRQDAAAQRWLQRQCPRACHGGSVRTAAGASRHSDPMFPGVMWRWCTHGCSAGDLPGVETQRRSGGCSANVPRRDVAVVHTWLQHRAFCQASRHSGAAAAAGPMSPGVTWRRCTHGCSTGFCQAPRCSGAAAVAAQMSPGRRWWRRLHGCSAGNFARRRSAAALCSSSS
jgi:hypothetical protein